MNEELRRFIATRVGAACFILLILLGNVWYVLRLTGQPAPPWLTAAFLIITGVAFLAGMGILAKILHMRFRKDPGSEDGL